MLLAAGIVGIGVSGLRWHRYLERRPAAVLPAIAGEAPGTLLFVYRRGDCPTFAGLPRRWGRLHDQGVVRVIGVPLGDAGPGDGPDAGGGAPPFPVRADLASAGETLMLRLGFRRTPFSVLLDGAGRVRMVVPPVPGEGTIGVGELAGGYARALLGPGEAAP